VFIVLFSSSIDDAVRHYLIEVVNGTFAIAGKDAVMPTLKGLVE
jgi:hypothetical protein